MKDLLLFLCGTLLLFWNYASMGDEYTIHDGFVSGEHYLNGTSAFRKAYAMGVIDGLMTAPLIEGSEKRALALGVCMEGMSDSQVAAILTKNLNDRPETWNLPVNISMYRALILICPGFRPE